MRPYKCSFSSPEEWLRILSSLCFLFPLSLTPILTGPIFLGREGGRAEGKIGVFFPLHSKNLYFILWARGRLLQNLLFITLFDFFMTASYPHLHVLVVSFSLSLPVYQTPQLVLERETLFPCSLLFLQPILQLQSSLSHLFTTQKRDFPPPEHSGRPSLHTFLEYRW